MTNPDSARPEQTYQVTLLELFFDLVFIFAVSQLSHHLLGGLSWRAVGETTVLLCAVYIIWNFTSWDATIAGVTRTGVRALVLIAMLLTLFMNAAVTRAFEGHAWAFVLPFLIMQLGRSGWMVFNAPTPLFRGHFQRTFAWLLGTAPLWIVGAVVGPETRLCWWGGAALLDSVGTWLAHPVPGRRLQSMNVGFDGAHILERARLFLLIALGETVLTTGLAIARAPITRMTVLTGTLALGLSISLWALLFGQPHRLTEQHLEETRDPIRAGRIATNTQILIVAGLIAVAVASERVIAHPFGPPSWALTLLLFGGPVLVRLELTLYLWLLRRQVQGRYLLSSAGLALLALVTRDAPPYVSLSVVSGGLLLLALLRWEERGMGGRRMDRP